MESCVLSQYPSCKDTDIKLALPSLLNTYCGEVLFSICSVFFFTYRHSGHIEFSTRSHDHTKQEKTYTLIPAFEISGPCHVAEDVKSLRGHSNAIHITNFMPATKHNAESMRCDSFCAPATPDKYLTIVRTNEQKSA